MSVDDAYEVVAVRYGRLLTTRAGAFLNHGDYGIPDGPFEFAYDYWIVRNAARTLVFDTGFAPDVGRRRGRELLIDPREALAALGVADDESTVVVLSHAHYDHIGNVDAFAHARFVMSAAEYDFWVENPRDQHLTRQLVEVAELDRLRALRASGRLELVHGPPRRAPGLQLLLAPGHTPGQLMLLVDSPVGGILLTADAVHFDEELDRRMPFRHMGDIVAAADGYAAIADLRSSGAAALVIAGHEPSYRGRFPADPRLPEHTLVLSADH